MKSQKSLFTSKGFSLSEYKRYFHNHQQEHIRKHLRIIESFSRHLSRAEVASELHIGENTIRLSINKYLQGGFDAVVAPSKRKQPTLLSKTQEAEFKLIILQKSPSDYQFDAHIWTGRLMVELVEKKYQVRYTLNGIYALLKRLELTHQKAHADYAEADPQKQKEFMAQFEENLLREPTTTAFVFADEFSISTKPTMAYAWAEKNTRPKVVTSEKKNERLNAFLATDITTSECFFDAKKTMKSEEVAEFLYQIAAELEKREIKKVMFFIDNNPTHKIKMRYNLALLPKLNIEIQICYLPPYSPKINLVEYLIHLVRLKKLHHAPHKRDMKEIKNELTEFLHLKKPFQVQNIVNILQNIKNNV